MTYLAIAASVAAVSGLLLAGLCRSAAAGDRDQPAPDPDRTAAAASGLFAINPEETDQP